MELRRGGEGFSFGSRFDHGVTYVNLENWLSYRNYSLNKVNARGPPITHFPGRERGKGKGE